MKWFLLLIYLGLAAMTPCAGQGVDNEKPQLENYIDWVIHHPEARSMVETRLALIIRDSAGFNQLRSILASRVQDFPENQSLHELLVWQFVQSKNFDQALVQEIAMDKRKQGNGSRVLDLGLICLDNEAYRVAKAAFQFILDFRKKSPIYFQARKGQLAALRKFVLASAYTPEDLANLHRQYQAFIGEFEHTADVSDVMLELARLDESYFENLSEARRLIEPFLEPSSAAGSLFRAACKMELGHIALLEGKLWESALLFTQVHHEFREEPLGQEALFEAAKAYYYGGEFRLAKSQLDILKSATSDLIANDAMDLSLVIQENTVEDTLGRALKIFSQAELSIMQHQYPRAEKILDSLTALFPTTSLADDVLMARYRIHFSTRQYPLAASDLGKVIHQYPQEIWGDDALFHLGELEEIHLKNSGKAVALYEKFLVDYPASYFNPQVRNHLRHLRGDPIL